MAEHEHEGGMTSIARGARGEIPTFVAMPSELSPWPGVVIVHDGLGMTEDLRNQARWLAGSGYLAAAPNLFHWGSRLRCLFRTMRDLGRGTQGPAFDDLSAVLTWLAAHPQCTGRVGITIRATAPGSSECCRGSRIPATTRAPRQTREGGSPPSSMPISNSDARRATIPVRR
jgi:hypothetical protein